MTNDQIPMTREAYAEGLSPEVAGIRGSSATRGKIWGQPRRARRGMTNDQILMTKRKLTRLRNA